MQIKLLQDIILKGKKCQSGDIIELPDDQAQPLVDLQIAQNVDDPTPAARSMPGNDAQMVARCFGGIVTR